MEQTIHATRGPQGEEIAYAVVGSGPLVVLAAWWVSNLELDWEDPGLRSFVETLAQRHTVVRYDRPGVGLSGRSERRYDIDGETAYLRAVVDAARAQTGEAQIDLVGISCGGPASIRFAVEEPERVRNLVLFASYLDGADITDAATRTALVGLVRANWGMGSTTLTSILLPGAAPDVVRRFNRAQRTTATADVAADLLDLTFALDATADARDLAVPTLVIHRTRDGVIPVERGRELAAAITGAEYCEIEGRVHVPWTADCSAALDRIEQFLTGEVAGAAPRRRLATLVMTDIVDSTSMLAAIGDAAWRSRLDELTRIVSEEAASRAGVVHKDTGDGALVSFALPGDAFSWAIAIRSRAQALEFDLRTGVHMGEVEERGDDVTGISVVIAARVCDQAAAGQILATATTAELAAGGRIMTVDVGNHDLKGIAGERTLVDVAPLEPTDHPDQSSDSAVPPGDSVIRFGEFELDATAFELRRNGICVDVEPQVFDVLRYLAERPGALVLKEQLLDDIWGDRFVSESSLSSRIRSARVAVGDDGQRQHVIKTVHGRGFRFVATIDPTA